MAVVCFKHPIWLPGADQTRESEGPCKDPVFDLEEIAQPT